MKNIFLAFIIFMGLGVNAQTPDDIFKEGNDIYKQDKFEEALVKYKSIEETGFVADDLFYNMANCYYKLNQVAPAILYYKKALKIIQI